MSTFSLSRAAGWLDDRLNAVTVKELRQAVRSRMVVAVLTLFLLGQLAGIGTYLLSGQAEGNFTAGRDVFMALNVALLLTCLLVIPGHIGTRMTNERSTESGMDLMFITTIHPASIVWGKLVSGLTITALIYSCCAPFMVLTYLLRDIDLPSIAAALGANLLIILVAIQLSILTGSLGVSRGVKILLGFVLIWLYWSMLTVVGGGISAMLTYGMGHGAGFWQAAAVFTCVSLAVTGLLFVLATAGISPPTANRALLVRGYVTGLWLASLIAVGIAVYVSRRTDLITVWLVWAGLLLGLMLIGSVSERDEHGPRVLKAVPQRKWLRPGAFLLYSGSGGGILWCVVMFLLTLAAAWGFEQVLMPLMGITIGRSTSPYVYAGTFALYALAYCLTALLIRRYLLKTKSTTTVAVLLVLLAGGLFLPPLISFFIAPEHWRMDRAGWQQVNPFALLWHQNDKAYLFIALVVSALWAGGALILSLPMIRQQWRAFCPPTATPIEVTQNG